MQTFVRSPFDIFSMPQRLLVPLFQRPYVWNEEMQWEPLWQDLRRLSELVIAEPNTSVTHFLGAVVIQSGESAFGHMQSNQIIDGQQRITTLQLLMDAAGSVLQNCGAGVLATRLEDLTHNAANYVADDGSRLKLLHTNDDRFAFQEVMEANGPVEHASLKHAGSPLAKAHAYFSESIRAWVNGESSDETSTRAHALVEVLMRRLQLVTIELALHENSQEIFETLNARGTPLTAADLIKNYVFQKLAAEGADTRRAYAEDWPFESPFWADELSVGRYKVSRSSLYLNQWLASRLGEEVSPQATFRRFKSYVEHDARQVVSSLLPEIKRQAEQYEAWTINAADEHRQLSATEMAFHRMSISGVEVLKPLIIALHRSDRGVPQGVIDAVIGVAESWMVRRQLLRLPSADMGRVVSDVIRVHRDTPADELAEKVEAYFKRLDVTSTYWPGDDEVRRVLLQEQVYNRLRPPRLRMVLHAVEDHLRARTGQSSIPRKAHQIEHVLPQKWEQHWPVDGPIAEQERASHVHRLGNLTLLTKKLNGAVSNGPWPNKREMLHEHDTFLLNRPFRTEEYAQWDEAAIDRRSEVLIDMLLQVWPAPEAHEGLVVDPRDRDEAWIEVRHLLEAGLLDAGIVLQARSGAWGDQVAVILPNGQLQVGESEFDSPSGAAKHLRGGATNGWYFWTLPDGRRLADVRAEHRGTQLQASRGSFDWSVLHAVLEALPAGRWTSYADLAEVVGTAAQPLGSHISRCSQCSNAHRVLTSQGRVAEDFAWSNGDGPDPADLLRREGMRIENARADRTRRLEAEELRGLLPELSE